MDSVISGYLPIIVLGLIALFVAWLLTNASRWLGPWRPNKVKTGVYESGMDPIGSAHDRFSVKFYLVAMLFILFDIEIVFMYPWAVQFKELTLPVDMGGMGLGILPLVEMLTFVLILFVGFIYVLKKGGLDWD